jgi:acetyl esterase/lipase
VNIPETVSPKAQEFLRTLEDPAGAPSFPEPGDLEAWKKLQDSVERDELAQSDKWVKRYSPMVKESRLGGIPVLDICPRTWQGDNKLAVYTHGGAHTMFSAASTLGRAAMFADDTGLQMISVDYTLAPFAGFEGITEQVISVISSLLSKGRYLKDIVLYGDSSGGGLAASVILKMRDHGMGVPGAAILVSPWVDLMPAGDTDVTLRNADPTYLYEKHGKNAAAAYADPKDQKNPYASPVYGDFSKGYPPTLIQGGTKEALLSGFIRLYQALDVAGMAVKLDIYEGMPHNFATKMPEVPESKLARSKIRDFVHRNLIVRQRAAA